MGILTFFGHGGVKSRRFHQAGSQDNENSGNTVRAVSKIEENFKPPNFTIKELRDVVPAHCFVRSTIHSMAYVVHDVALMSCLFFLATKIDSLPLLLRCVAWPAYWVAQGIVCFGIWILGHECGHRAFSASNVINDSVGLILHSWLLVPFHSWRHSHSTHHKSTNHMDRDQPFVPRTRQEVGLPFGEMLEDAPLYRFGRLFLVIFFGFPMYLAINLGGPKPTKRQSHYNPFSILFQEGQESSIFISDAGILVTLSILAYFALTFSFFAVLKFYIIPYLFVNFWLVLITFLQHTHPMIPHYRDGEWTFVRGALCTVDRDFGILNYFFHHITDTHIAHHLFSQMPFYHAEEATKHIKKVLGPYYNSDDTHFLKSLISCDKLCVFVEDEGDIVFYRGWN